MLFNRIPMRFCGITFVFRPLILREISIKTIHNFVTVSLGKHRSCRDRQVLAIAFDDAVVWSFVRWFVAIAIDQQRFWCCFELINRLMHGFIRSIEDVDLINSDIIYYTNSPSQGLFFDNRTKGIALFLSQLLGVIKQFVFELWGEDYCSCNYWARQTSAAGFIASSFNKSFGMKLLEHVSKINERSYLSSICVSTFSMLFHMSSAVLSHENSLKRLFPLATNRSLRLASS